MRLAPAHHPSSPSSSIARHVATLARLLLTAAVSVVALAHPAVAQLGGPSGPKVTVTPASGTFNGPGTTYTLNVAIEYCSNAAFNTATRVITLDGVDVRSSFGPSGTVPSCPYAARWAGNIVLTQANDGVHTFSASIEDVNGYFGGSNKTYTFRWPGYQPPKYDVRVVAQSAAIDATAGSARSVQFTVTNTGSRPATYNLTRTCSGAATCTGGTPSSFTLDTTAAGRSSSATLTFTAGAAGGTGRVQLKATNTTYAAAADSAATDVFIAPTPQTPSPGVTIVSAGDAIEKSLCLTVAAGDGAAYECGDLRLAHALPTVTTWGKPRTPVLLYNSAQAGPVLAVQADVAPGSTVPQTVEARVKVNGVQWGYGSWSGSQWGANTARRITVPITSAPGTGHYGYTLEVTYTWPGGGQSVTSASGALAVVNRSASPFGAGWWLAGLEQLVVSGSDLLWIGGDGSTRWYTSAGTNLWRGANLTRPDSIYASGGAYYRRLPSGTLVQFDGTGKHVATRPLVGHATYFNYDGSSRLSRIVIPTALADGDVSVRYDFTYYTDSVVATLTSVGGLTRRSRALLNAGRLTGIRDPDGTSVAFAYGTGGNTRRVENRTDRRSHTTYYRYDAIGHLAGDSLPIAGGAPVAQSFEPAESRGAVGTPNGAAQPVDSAFTRVDGPRTDVTDVTKIWITKYGAPSKIRDARGYYTTIVFDATWPALASEVRSPGGAISRAWYTPRGLVDSSKTENFRSTGDLSGTTTYTWDTRFAAATQVVGAGGEITQYSYNADGTVAWVQPGTDASRRTTVAYYTTGGLTGRYRASSVPGRSERDSVVYDATLGNTIQVKDRRGYWSYSTRDGLGRVTLARGEFQASHWRRDSTEYDLADRVVWTRSWADTSSYLTVQSGGGYIDADTLYVSNSYDTEGNLLAVKRWTRPNPAGLDTVADNFLYDEAGRRTSEWNVAGVDNTYSYDAAGNLVRHQSLTKNITSSYDELGRVVQRITGKRVYTGTSCQTFVPWGNGTDCRFSFPLQTNGAFLTIPADTALFAYDAGGNMLRADNVAARIRRTYSPGGLLLTDSSYVRTLRYLTEGNAVPSQFAAHPYGIRYAYDAAGRLDTLWHPDLLDPCTGPCAPQRYVYDTQLGRLTSVIDVRGQTIGFTYTLAGQLEAVNYPGGISELTHYDADGLVADRSVGSATSKFIADTLQHDPLGRITFGTGKVVRNGQPQTVTNAYKGLGALAATEHTIYGGTPTFEEFKTDGLGNVTWSNRHQVHLGGSADNPSIRDHLYDAHGRVVHIAPEDTVQLEDYDYRHYWYDNEGRILFQTHRVVNEASFPSQEAHYYDGAGRLVMLERRVGWAVDTSLTHINDPMGLTEYYRYDALGRRVLVHTLRDNSRCFQLGCESTVARFVWAGDQLLYETRGKAKSTDASSTVEDDKPYGNGEYGAPNAYGRVAYTHAGGIDRPLGMIRMNDTVLASVYPHANWRGLYETATDESGSQYASRDVIKWPGVVASIYMGATTKPDSVFWWFGSQITESEDASGLMYRRNRYYDPASGRFTQPDPIGIAGGLNAYGFAGGDPVNNSDPFGLCFGPLALVCAWVAEATLGEVAVAAGTAALAAKATSDVAQSAQWRQADWPYEPRPKFRKGTKDDVEAELTPGARDNTYVCPTCGKTFPVRNPDGSQGYDIHHAGDPWALRKLKLKEKGAKREEVRDEYQKDVEGRCPSCNRGDNKRPETQPN